MLQSTKGYPLLKPRTTTARPLSDATEILDTDFEDDFDSSNLNDSPRRSVDSFAGRSVSTVSTENELPTPQSADLSGFSFQVDGNKPVQGPVGPHLFRSSLDSSDFKSSLEVDFVLAKSPVAQTFDLSPAKSQPESDFYRRASPQPSPGQVPQTQLASLTHAVSQLDVGEVGSWSPQQVADWMRRAGFEESVVEKLLINDITGTILLELQFEDLKELDIRSFGKRHRLMNSIQHLRNSLMVSSPPPQGDNSPVCTAPPRKSPNPRSPPPHHDNECNTPTSPNEERRTSPKHRHRSQRRHHRTTEDVRPGDSVSIVAIEQLLPKPHKCSKGENCPKWQKRQRKLARLAKDLPIELYNGSSFISGDPGNAATAENIVYRPKSDATPSLVASSDVLGPQQAAQFKLSEEKLNEVQPRDPQENVRQFLNFQHMSALKLPDEPATPRADTFPSPDTPGSAKTNVTLSENLRHLPKLTIPEEPANGGHSANLSAQRTITPSILANNSRTPTARAPAFHDYNPYMYGQAISPADMYRQETPFSEMDVPVTAVPLGPIERDVSQSVPPDMRYGDQRALPHIVEPIARPSSTKNERQRRRPSFQTLSRLDEDKALRPIETPEDLDATPRAGNRLQKASDRRQTQRPRQNSMEEYDSGSSTTPTDVTHSGWMKKRKTTRLLRHEWQDHHFTLRGTQLAMYPDEQASRRASKALEHIDVDDYAVACSSLASNSKLTAAFKKTVLKRRDSAVDQTAFGFSLIPGTEKNGSSSDKVDRKALFLSSSGKPHHFAVKTRDERIDWMRELMLAKALKKGKEDGGVVRVNGNFI
ncbi:hypothetical protein FQN54_003725 [Arachnomyces sp. PD_36]|nr:hypothetical protein FQN54_003725 [Arachnomyces sp. PD_36]